MCRVPAARGYVSQECHYGTICSFLIVITIDSVASASGDRELRVGIPGVLMRAAFASDNVQQLVGHKRKCEETHDYDKRDEGLGVGEASGLSAGMPRIICTDVQPFITREKTIRHSAFRSLIVRASSI